MDAKAWKAAISRAFPKDRAVKLLIVIGLCGVALLSFPSLFGGREKKEEQQEKVQPTGTEDYKAGLESELSRVVSAITGEDAPTVLVTLQSGSRYVYAADEKTDSRASGEETERETEHVILKGSDGAQHALTVTEIQPEVKGVVIVSRYAGDPIVREKLTDAARTALDVSAARVCVMDTG